MEKGRITGTITNISYPHESLSQFYYANNNRYFTIDLSDLMRRRVYKRNPAPLVKCHHCGLWQCPPFLLSTLLINQNSLFVYLVDHRNDKRFAEDIIKCVWIVGETILTSICKNIILITFAVKISSTSCCHTFTSAANMI